MRIACKSLIAVFAVLMQVACSDDGSSNPADEGGSTHSGSAWNGEPLVDSRDGKTYKTVQIGDQLWMAENLNYKTDSSYCYNNEESNCSKYGRLYRWAAAVGKSDSTCGWGSFSECNLPEGNIQGVCPSGWHLPSEAEFQRLLSMVGGHLHAGPELKSTEGWNEGGDGIDAYSFSALPAGYVEWGRYYKALGDLSLFWSSTEFDERRAYYMGLKAEKVSYCHKISEDDPMVVIIPDSCPTYDNATVDWNEKYNGYSVRCLRDEPADYKPSKTDRFIIDDRDNQVYATTKIGNQVWMAENLNFKTDSSVHCGDYGLHYNWADAIGKPDEECGDGHSCSLPKGNIRGICPKGWHLPSKSEWEALIEFVGGEDIAGLKLKTTPEWFAESGTDEYGFSAFPAGYKGHYLCEYETSVVFFWTSTQEERKDRDFDYSEDYAYAAFSYWYENSMHVRAEGKSLGSSVRCVRD